MKKLIITLVVTAALLGACTNNEPRRSAVKDPSKTSAQASAAVTPTVEAPKAILLDGYGYNTRFPDVKDPWNNTEGNLWRTGLVTSAGHCIRYPGGTVANYWDAATNRLFGTKNSESTAGWVDVAKVGDFQMIKDIILNKKQQENSLVDLKRAVDAGATPVFVLNLLTPGKDFYESPQGWNRPVNGVVGSADWYAMLDDRYNRTKQILIKANSQGIAVKLIELGNEFYIANCPYNEEAFPTGSDYATAANYIAKKISRDPDLKFLAGYQLSVPGAIEETAMSSPRIVNWDNQMVPNLDRNLIQAISLHNYQPSSIKPETFTDANLRRYVGSWLSEMQTTIKQKNTAQQIFDNNWHTWWTEVSVGRSDNPNFKKWGQALAQVYAALWTFEHTGQLYMFGNLNSASVVDPATGTLKNTGWALRPLMMASKGKLRARKLNLLSYEADLKLKGIAFQDDDVSGSGRRACLVNLTNTAITVNLTNVFPAAGNLRLYGVKQPDLNSTANPVEIPNRTEPTPSVALDPYSVSYVAEP